MIRMPSFCPASLRLSVKCGMLKLQNIWRYRYDKISCNASAPHSVCSNQHCTQTFILAVQWYAVPVGVDVLAFQCVTCNCGVYTLFAGTVAQGICVLVLAFLVSPLGLQMLALKLATVVDSIGNRIWELVY